MPQARTMPMNRKNRLKSVRVSHGSVDLCLYIMAGATGLFRFPVRDLNVKSCYLSAVARAGRDAYCRAFFVEKLTRGKHR
jgi:hypothetical protein